MSRPFWVPLIASFGTIILLYIIGFIANIDLLVFKFSPSYTEVSLIPIVAGIVVGFISEWIVKFSTVNV